MSPAAHGTHDEGGGPNRTGIPLGHPFELGALVARHGGSIPPALAQESIDRITTPRHARGPTDLVIVTSPRMTPLAMSGPGVLLVDAELAARVPADRTWVHAHVWWVVAHLIGERGDTPSGGSAAMVAPEQEGVAGGRATGIHPRAVVSDGARVAASAVVRAGAVVREDVTVGEGCDIGENAVLHPRTELGVDCRIGAGAVLGSPGFGFARGPGGEVVRIPQLGGVVLEEGVEVGPLCTIDAGTLSPTIIGSGTKLDAHVHVGHNVEIGRGVWVAAQCGFAGSSVVGDGVRVGGQAGVADHVTIGRGATIAAKSGVIGDIPDGAVVAGFPAVDRIRWLRSMASLLDRSRLPRRGRGA
jgi:UDP-3-O-[3-hydroxymyristoyl] glucosamine N-acyltransferase